MQVTWTGPGDGSGEDDDAAREPGEPTAAARAQQAENRRRLLTSFDRLPGTDAQGTVNAEVLRDWTVRVLKLAREAKPRGRRMYDTDARQEESKAERFRRDNFDERSELREPQGKDIARHLRFPDAVPGPVSAMVLDPCWHCAPYHAIYLRKLLTAPVSPRYTKGPTRSSGL